MAIFRINKTNNYTVMSNYHLKEQRLSLKAKGLLSVMLSLPENWNYSIKGLVAICKENETSIKTALTELKQMGYLKITKLTPNQTESGRYEYIYDVYEEAKQDTEKQGIEILPLENQHVENICLNKINNDKKLNNKELNNIYINEFEEIWKAYPNKKGKDNSKRDYIKARKDGVTYETIVNGLKKYLMYCRKEKNWYKPKNGSTWFHQRSWNDEYEIEITTEDLQMDLTDF